MWGRGNLSISVNDHVLLRIGPLLQPGTLHPQWMNAFSRLLATHLGCHLREASQATFGQRLLQRVRALGLPSVEAYYQLLSSSHPPVTENAEWRELISIISVTESYFFRDKGQFSLLHDRLLPELIARKRQLSAVNPSQARSLKVWSAGCATGEEAYSLAILLKEQIPAGEQWAISVVGTDMNQTALMQAQRGIYNSWSFRSLPLAIQEKYFRQYHHDWSITPEVANWVTFKLDNLLQSSPIDGCAALANVDLILCRNVFIYFDARAIATVLERFYHALSPGGYLMTGHTELYGQSSHSFRVNVFPESIVYQREFEPSNTNQPFPELNYASGITPGITPGLNSGFSYRLNQEVVPGFPVPGTAAAKKDFSLPQGSTARTDISCQEWVTSENTLLEHTASENETLGNEVLDNETLDNLDNIVALLYRKAYSEAIAQAQDCISRNVYVHQACCLLAEAYANLGQYAHATQACQQAFQCNPLGIEPLYVLARIAQEQGNLEEAKIVLKRLIYLEPASTLGYFELGCLYEQQGNLEKAQRNWRSSLSSLAGMNEATLIHGCRELTVGELQMVLEQKLNQKASKDSKDSKGFKVRQQN